MSIVTLTIRNRTSKYQNVEFNVDLYAVPEIVSWYAAYTSGDDISVWVDGVKQRIDGDWGLEDGMVLR